MATALEMATEKPEGQVRAGQGESRIGAEGRSLPGSAEQASPARRGRRRRSIRGSESPSTITRFFLTKDGSSGIPELAREVEDENTAMVEALKTGSTFIILSEWRPTVDNATKGRPMITKEAVSKGK